MAAILRFASFTKEETSRPVGLAVTVWRRRASSCRMDYGLAAARRVHIGHVAQRKPHAFAVGYQQAADLRGVTPVVLVQDDGSHSPVALAELFGTLSEIYRPVCEESGVDLRIVPPSGTVRADRTLLIRAIANLLDNALNHTPPGGLIEMEAVWNEGVATIRVSDTGDGILEGEEERIFERFVRLESSAANRGTGLGLPIARMLARAHGGDLVAGRCQAGGAVFSLRIPGNPGAATPAAGAGT
ncbi:MAG: sensor histidine kinase [Myxococcota bacterium]